MNVNGLKERIAYNLDSYSLSKAMFAFLSIFVKILR